MIPKWGLFAISALFLISVSPAFAQHHSGAIAPPVDFDGLKVAISTILSPEDYSYEEDKTANLSVRFFDSETNVNIKSVTYRIQIFHESTLVANEYYFDEDGKLDVKIKPTTGCPEKELWKCTQYNGEKHAIAGAYYARGDSLPTIQGPVFDRSGQYNIKVSIVGATNPRTMTTTDLLFETFLSIPQNEIFLIKDASAQEIPISVKSYNGDISNFSFDESSEKISYEIPNDHKSGHIHSSDVKQVISIKKEFSSFKQGHHIDVLVNGIQLQDSSFDVDVSVPGKNIIRINTAHDEFIMASGDNDSPDATKIELVSGERIEFNHLDFAYDNGYSASVMWDSESFTSKEISFVFSFFDQSNSLVNDILFAYSITDESGSEVWSNIGTNESYLGILAPHGIAQESITIPADGNYKIKLILTGQNSGNFESFMISDSSFSILSQNQKLEKEDVAIPAWVKSNAGWWADGQIDDGSFVEGMQFLIREGFMSVSG
ncbi:MAG: hypothetical protein GKS07_09710 [Nitrosopumilus sp.]|nr:MAG: hypothetical protein GKS07_09710 [Nitrosopumilus sp.]